MEFNNKSFWKFTTALGRKLSDGRLFFSKLFLTVLRFYSARFAERFLCPLKLRNEVGAVFSLYVSRPDVSFAYTVLIPSGLVHLPRNCHCCCCCCCFVAAAAWVVPVPKTVVTELY